MRQGSFKVTFILFCLFLIDSTVTQKDLISFLQKEESKSNKKIEILKEEINTNIKKIEDLEWSLLTANMKVTNLENKMQKVLETIERWSKPLNSNDLSNISSLSGVNGIQFAVYR